MTTKDIPLSALKSDPSLQPRAVPFVSPKAEEYALALEAGDPLPPITVVERGGHFVIVVGHNRAEAHRLAGRDTIAAEIIPDIGNDRLFWEIAVPSNSTHGAGYEDADKKAIFDRFISEGRHKLPDGQRRTAAKIAADLPFRVSQQTVDRWLKARGLGTTDNRGRGFYSVSKRPQPTPTKPTKSDIKATLQEQIDADPRYAGKRIVSAPGGGFRVEEKPENPNTTKTTLTLAAPYGQPRRKPLVTTSTIRTPIPEIKPMHDARVLIDRLGEVVPLIATADGRHRQSESEG